MLLSTQTIPEKYHTNTQASWVASNIQELHSRQADEIKSCFQSSSLLFLPKMTSLPSPQDELLNGGLPILCHYKSGLKKQTDKSIALFASKNNSELPFNPHHAIEDYAEVLEMLYFDQCAQKLLLKRAQKKYKRKLNTGGIPTEALLLSFAATKGNISLSLHSI
ncbi:MAG TPA: hypothetical protein ENJ45_05500 [Phaeodactylibacter sp.]|nr:hypothetical protein [Phaeodactylibacter sp.]